MKLSSISKINEHYLRWISFIKKPYNALNVVISLALLRISYEVTTLAAVAATKSASNPITDIVYDYIPRVDTSFIHENLSGYLYDLRIPLFIIFIKYVPFGAKALAILILFRALCINLTHLGIPDGIVPINSNITFGGDLFFSGHVANMFMLGLIYWNIKTLRYICMLMSFVFGISAVLGHYHYTIDVVAAPFFAYGIFILCQKVFKEDYLLTVNNNNSISKKE